MQFAFHVEKLLCFGFGQLVDGNTGPDAEHFGDALFINFVEQINTTGFNFGFFRSLFSLNVLLFVAQTTGFFVVLIFDGLLLGLLHFGQTSFHLFEIGRCLHALDTQTTTGFVNEVDGLVGKMTIGNVTVGQVGGCNKCLIGDGDTVM